MGRTRRGRTQRTPPAGSVLPGRDAGERLLARILASDAWQGLALAAAPGRAVHGVAGCLFALLARGLVETGRGPLLLLVAGSEEAESVLEDLQLLGAGTASLLPPEAGDYGERVAVAVALAEGNAPPIHIASVGAAVDPLPTRSDHGRGLLVLRTGADLERDSLVERLSAAGFERADLVEEPGTWSMRGDVVDFRAFAERSPLRVEFLGGTIEELRRFDPSSQMSIGVEEEARVSLLRPGGGNDIGSLPELLPSGTLILRREPARLQEALARHLALFEGPARTRREAAWEALEELRSWETTRAPSAEPGALDLDGRVPVADGTRMEDALRSLDRIACTKELVVLACETAPEAQRFFGLLADPATEGVSDALRGRPPLGLVGTLSGGFQSPALGIACMAHRELFATPVRRPRMPRRAPPVTRPLESFLDLREGDHVVHLSHGIARYEGIERIERGGADQDCLVLTFRDDVRMFVPAVRIDLVQRYVGGRGEHPELSRIGGRSWERRKEAVQQAVADLAADLLETQAARQRFEGIAHPHDRPWQQEFEAAFPWQMTPDQAAAIEEIKRDLEAPRPMDRLLCGDVGFGKTEVAVRAAFKVVTGSRQVAILVPTTVLAQQHTATFRERVSDYPVEVACLSRFQTAREQSQTVEGLKNGTVDIVIGTHRLLQKDVGFHDLGLLVIDEEQRFGVAAKERIKRLRREVDVLMMTATPIPRTLHQALLGIRDISSLGQAPAGRQAIETRVVPRDLALVRRGILQELDREGQVFFIHNRVQSIERTAREVRELVPEARVLVAHGQMPGRELERTMLAFIRQEADVLVSTTIVESGVDIPSVNTLFVDRAEHYGLADLHQLRGRVGRWKHQAHAWFLVKPDAFLTEASEKRLRAIEEFDRLGAGLQIAMRDMELRGVGNILGSAQSGHIDAVGYDMYCRLLKAVVSGLRQEDVRQPSEAELNLDFTAFLPDAYIPDSRVRMEMYRRLGRLAREEEFRAVIEEMRDRFGAPPPEALEFVDFARIRALLEDHGIRRLEILPGEGPALQVRRRPGPAALGRLGDDQLRVLAPDRVLLVHPGPFGGPRELLVFLARCLGETAGVLPDVPSG